MYVQFTTLQRPSYKLELRCKIAAMLLQSEFSVVAFCHGDPKSKGVPSFRLFKVTRDIEWEKGIRHYAAFTFSAAKMLFLRKFSSPPPTVKKAFADCTAFNCSRLSTMGSTTARRSYSKRHCNCSALLHLKYIDNEEDAAGNEECLANFKSVGAAWYVWNVIDTHEGCIPFHEIVLSVDEEHIVGEILLENHLACVLMSQSIVLVKARTGIDISVPDA